MRLSLITRLSISIVFLWVSAPTNTAMEPPSWPLKVKTVEIVSGVQKAWLEDQLGTPFFYNADTCWFLAFKATDDEIRHYFKNRSQKGITVVQSMLIPWARQGEDNWFGEKPAMKTNVVPRSGASDG